MRSPLFTSTFTSVSARSLCDQSQTDVYGFFDSVLESIEGQDLESTGVVVSIGDGIARVSGLEGVQAGELVFFPSLRFMGWH